MTEREKMEQGGLYDANYDPELLAMRDACKDLCFAYNQLPPSNLAEQQALLAQLLGRVDPSCRIVAPFWCDYGSNIFFENDCFANHNCVILDAAPVRFGHHVFIGPNCGFYTAGHPLDAPRRAQGLEYAHPITVGNNVWFGGGVQVLPGVTIGDNCVIGSGSVVTRDIPANSLAAGNPCRVLRPITEADAANQHQLQEELI